MESPLMLREVAAALERDPAQAEAIFNEHYAEGAPISAALRKMPLRQAFAVFRRDGFIDRYTGRELVLPAALRLLSRRLGGGDETRGPFPYHPNWKRSVCHLGYWDWSPTIDHLQPLARSGADDLSNWVTMSGSGNIRKRVATLDELPYPPGDLNQWDGMTSWFVAQTEADPTLLADPYFRRWYRAATAR